MCLETTLFYTVIKSQQNIVELVWKPGLSQADPKVTLLDLLGPPGKRVHRSILLSQDSSLAAFWWSVSGQEVFPWTPQMKEEDRANVMLYSLKNPNQPSRLGFIRTHTDPIGFRFCDQSSSMQYIGQEIGRRGEVQIESAIIFPYSGDRSVHYNSICFSLF